LPLNILALFPKRRKGKKMTGKKIVAANLHAPSSPQSVAAMRPAHFPTDTNYVCQSVDGQQGPRSGDRSCQESDSCFSNRAKLC
jgi:hypothetical protein